MHGDSPAAGICGTGWTFTATAMRQRASLLPFLTAIRWQLHRQRKRVNGAGPLREPACRSWCKDASVQARSWRETQAAPQIDPPAPQILLESCTSLFCDDEAYGRVSSGDG